MKRLLTFLFTLIVSALFASTLSSPVHAAPPANFQTSLIVGSGLNGPSGFDIAPDGRIFILQRTGEVKVYKNGALLPQDFIDLPAIASGDRGLIGVAFDPNFLTNHYVYFYYTALDLHNYLVRVDATGDTAGSNPLILYETNDQSFQLHVGGTIRFGPDGKLYVSIGDNGTPTNAQDLSNPHGKILRLNPDGTIPLDNPFVGQSGKLPEIYAYGFRNPFRFSFDTATGNMFEGDVGEATWEEVNHVFPGKNYGWPNCEGYCIPTNPNYTDPIYDYNHDGGSAAVMVGPVYHGQMFPSDYQGRLFFGDYAKGFIKTMTLDGNGNSTGVSDFDTNAGSVVEIREDNRDGSLYYITYFPGALYKITYSTGTKVPVANATADVTGGASPLTVHFSSQGSNDPNGLPLTYNWDFGDGTTSTDPNPTKVYTTQGKYTVQLTVNNGTYSDLANPIVIQAGMPPTVSILTPADKSTYKAGDTITVSASATDGTGMQLSGNQISTTIVFHHQTHIHPFLGPLIGSTQTFTIPTTGEVSPVTWYEIDVTATDSHGLTTTAVENIYPIEVNMTFQTQPTGLQILLDEQPFTTTQTIAGVVNFQRELNSPLTQSFNGKIYQFDHWSDGGPMDHTIITPSVDTTYTAFYREVTAWNGQYYSNKDLSGTPTLTRQDPVIDFNWDQGSPDPSLPVDGFSIRWTNSVYFNAGDYTFTANTDDGARLIIDGTTVIDAWHDQSNATPNVATVTLSAGTHTIEFDYFEDAGGASAKLVWDIANGSGQPPTITPTPTPTQGLTKLGGMNLDGYCSSQNNGSAVLVNNTWQCSNGTAIVMTTACVWQYTDPNATAQQDIAGNPYSWSCYTTGVKSSPTPTTTPTPPPGTQTKLGGLNLDGYCSSNQTGTAQLVNNTWQCSNNAVIDMTAACVWQYTNSQAVAQQDIPNNPYSWSCYVGNSTTPTPTPSTKSYTGKYWNITSWPTNGAPTIPTTTPTFTRSDAAIDFDWGNGSPDSSITPDHFVAQWTETIPFDAASYHFTTTSDDGIRVYIDNQVLIDQWNDHGSTVFAADKTMTAGNHDIRVEYYENSGGAVAKFSFTKNTGNPTPTPTPSQTKLGGMNLDGYCTSQNLGGAVLTNNTWNCTGNNQLITMTNACVWQYTDPNAVAQQDTANNPYSWSCYSN